MDSDVGKDAMKTVAKGAKGLSSVDVSPKRVAGTFKETLPVAGKAKVDYGDKFSDTAKTYHYGQSQGFKTGGRAFFPIPFLVFKLAHQRGMSTKGTAGWCSVLFILKGVGNNSERFPLQCAGFSPSLKPLTFDQFKMFSMRPLNRDAVTVFEVHMG